MSETRAREILDRAAELLRQAGAGALTPAAARLSTEWPATEKLARSLDWGQPRVGDMPPQPPTLRARIGAAVVWFVRRSLFWYSGQIVAFQRLVTNAAEEQLRTFAELERKVNGSEQSIARLQASLDQLRQEVTAELMRRDRLVRGSGQQSQTGVAGTPLEAGQK
jgi:hypothetical protein